MDWVKPSMALARFSKVYGNCLRLGASEKPKPRQVRCHYMVTAGQCRNQVAEHMRRSGKAMQQENRWGSLCAGLAIKDPIAADGSVFIADHYESPYEIWKSGLTCCCSATPPFQAI